MKDWRFAAKFLYKSAASESAAREAWEEAGAKGWIEDKHFGAYLDNKRGISRGTGTREVLVKAFLFEVHSTVEPKERGRNPNWFSVNDAKRQLAEGRSPRSVSQIVRIIDSAADFLMGRNRSGRRFSSERSQALLGQLAFPRSIQKRTCQATSSNAG